MREHPITRLAADYADGMPRGITSVCSAHPLVIEAALRQALEDRGSALIEATCNQVNHEGGYTGKTPEIFRDEVYAIADRVGLEHERVILGGDHLGPNPWKHLPADEALHRAETMVRAYAAAGFEKIHLDTSMGCAGESVALPDTITAQRTAQLAVAAEKAAVIAKIQPYYVIGTEVQTPGGALEKIEHLEVTSPEAAQATLNVHERAFAELGIQDAFHRVVALVVQPGVEFGHANVVMYDAPKAQRLTAALSGMPNLVFEAHSTDYQPPAKLASLVESGFAILKVGPGLTFALREALYALDYIAGEIDPTWPHRALERAMERVMLADPSHWRSHYRGKADHQRLLRHYSYSDRIRYYWLAHEAQDVVARLMTHLGENGIPETLVSQYLPQLYPRVAAGELRPVGSTLLLAAVSDVLAVYARACRTRAD